LKGGGLFGLGNKNEAKGDSGEVEGAEVVPNDKLVSPSKDSATRKSLNLRKASYSTLDGQQVTEPGLTNMTDSSHVHGSRGMEEKVVIEGHVPSAQFVQEQERKDAEDAENNDAKVIIEGHVPSEEKKQEQEEMMRQMSEDRIERAPAAEDRVTAALDALEEGAEPEKKLSVVLVSSEVARFAKTGGLADVADKLAEALAKRGHRVMTVMPMYGQYDGAVPTGVCREFNLWGGKHGVQYHHKWEANGVDANGNETGVDRVFVDHPCFRRPGMYGEWGQDYADNLFRFALFSWASIEASLCQPTIAPFGEDVVFIANDWQTGLVPLILASNYRRFRMFGPARSIFVIHNMGYHGVYPNPPTWESPKFSWHDLGLPDDSYYDRFVWTFPIDERPSKGRDPRDTGEAIKLLRGGIEMADRVVTVAPSYKDEIMSCEGGFGMHDCTRGRSYHLDGILNGIDIQEWNPSNDSHIAAPFTADNITNKSVCKQSLQFDLGLEQKPDTPIVAFIGRLAPQKGVDVLEQVLGWLMGGDHLGVTGDVQLVMMGSGEGRYAEFLMRAESQFKGRVVGYVGFSPEMEHKIIAGADILIMPSKYEPCGLPQMYAQRYGTIPVVHATGGLKDSVVQYSPFYNKTLGEDIGTGWQFTAPDEGGVRFGLWNALHTYKHYKDSWQELMVSAMSKDFSWELSAKKYEQVMRWAKMDQPFTNPWPFQ